MHTLHLVIGLALSFLQPVVHSGDYSGLVPLDSNTQDRIIDLFNRRRARVDPEGGNIQRVYWSDELAEIAAGHAELCYPVPNENRHQLSGKFAVVGENIGLSFQLPFANIFTLIRYWFMEGRFYNYETGQCEYLTKGFDTCDHYLQAVYAGMCEVGCAIAACPYKLPIEPFYTYLDYLYLPYYKLPTPYLVVCNFGPGNPDPYQPPYINATSCSYCPDEYPLCTNSTENEDSTRSMRTRMMPPSPPGNSPGRGQ